MRASALLKIMVVATLPVLFSACAPDDLEIKRGSYLTADERGSYKVGKPYKVGGIWYYPKEDLNYFETGTASWYGPKFHGKTTANGEVYDKKALTAAHPTLQLPSLVRVTNVRNGRKAVVRVNDRGPFSGGRIIDLSERAAEVLGFKAQGTTEVQVEVLTKESEQVAELARKGASAAEMDAFVLARFGSDPASDAPLQVASASGADPETVSATATRGIFVQAGSFANKANAHRLQSQLSQYGRILVDPVKRAGNTLYRVRIGPFGSIDTAGSTLARLVGEGLSGASVAVD